MRRVALGKLEDAEGLELAQRVLVNDDLDGAVGELKDIIEEIRHQNQPCPG
jgi:guanylate kinase